MESILLTTSYIAGNPEEWSCNPITAYVLTGNTMPEKTVPPKVTQLTFVNL